jgi:adenylosuccinate synthase
VEEAGVPVTAVVGAQWGDEGKGKITDLLSQEAGVVVRFGGGANAGHTVVNPYGEFKLHAIPSGIFNPEATALIGTGAVVDLDSLRAEIDEVASAGVDVDGLRISTRAHLVMPYHLLLDRLRDEARNTMSIGTTRRGIGPTYADKADRVGIQAGDLLFPDVLRQKLALVLPRKNAELEAFGHRPVECDELMDRAAGWWDFYAARLTDQVPLIDEALSCGRRILLEGQLGSMRDLDWGTYPYVTSSTTIAGGGGVGGGIPPAHITDVVGVVKAYTSAVGTGPLPTELRDEEGHELRERGAEYGATTGRPRRVGWFDAVAARYGRMLNGFTGIAVTKLDVLDGLPSIPICHAYSVDGVQYDTVPPTPLLERALPLYEEMPGWSGSTAGAGSWDELPAAAQRYLGRIEELVGAPISIVSVGPAREQTIRH